MREKIVAEIKRLAPEIGKPPGKQAFAKSTGIREHQWSGVIWARWSDALREAGFEGNELQGRFKTEDVLSEIILACRHYGKIPTSAEMRLYRLEHPGFPSHNTISNHFPSRQDFLQALMQRTRDSDADQDISEMIPDTASSASRKSQSERRVDGWVYLLKSGDHYKIGRSDELERRIKEIRIALPESVSLVHVIKTDDPPGIEAYWHRRFASKRANGEWFKLESSDLISFKRRKYQ